MENPGYDENTWNTINVPDTGFTVEAQESSAIWDLGDDAETEDENKMTYEEGEMTEVEAGVSVKVKNSDITAEERGLEVGDAAVLQVHAFNRLEADVSVKLYFWSFDGILPESKELWGDILAVPCTDIGVETGEGMEVEPSEYKDLDGSSMEGQIYYIWDKIENDVAACYLLTELSPGTETDFEVSVHSDTDNRVAVVPVIAGGADDKYFDEVYLTWTGTDNSKAEETDSENMESEHFLQRAAGTEQLNPSDFASMRLIVMVSGEDRVVDPEHVIADYGNIYLLQYHSTEQSMNAYMYYKENADAVEPDTVVETAADAMAAEGTEWDVTAEAERIAPDTAEETTAEDSPVAPVVRNMTEDQNPVTALAEKQDSSAAQMADGLIALVDTGVSEGGNIIDRVSLIGDELEGNGHGNEMAAAIASQNPDAKILSIRAVGNDGRGTISSVVAAMEYAINQNAKIINLSIYAKRGTLNSVLESEIKKAVSRGIYVVGAAGNDGADASGYMPGGVEEAWIIGACDEKGTRREDSNYGSTVDYYVSASSTSEAAAKFCGYISANGVESVGNVLGSGMIFENISGEAGSDTTAAAEEADTENGDFLLAAAPDKFKIQDGDPAWAPMILRSGRASTHKRKVIFGNEERWIYCLEPLKGEPVHNTEFSISSAVQLGADDEITKALYYLYGGPAWGKTVNGVNLKTIMTDAGCSNDNNYYAMTHFVMAYFYLNGDELKWNAHPEGPGVLNSAGIKLVKTLAGHIRNMPGITEATATLSESSVSAYYDESKNTYVSQPITYYTFSGNTAKIPLPEGVILINDSTGAATLSGNAIVDGGNTFHFEAAVSPGTVQDYTLTCAVVRDFTAYRKDFSGNAQDMGFMYDSDDREIGFSVNWPSYGCIEIEKLDASTGTTAPAGGYNMDGAKYTIYTSEGEWVEELTIYDGRAVSGTLTPGRYTVRETAAPPYYQIDNTSYEVTVPASQTVKIVSADTPMPVQVRVKKQSTANEEILGLTGYAREGAEFGIYTDRNCTDRLAVLTTDGQGMTTEFTLPLPDPEGPVSTTYYVREDRAPAGHKPHPEPVPFTVSYPLDAGKTITIDVSNDPEFADVNTVIEKLDEKGNRIEGVQFEVRFYDSDKLDTGKLLKTWVLASDANGEIHMDEAHKVSGESFYTWNDRVVVPKGYLTIQESRTPAHYVMDDTVYEWDTAGKELTVKTVYNDLEPGKITLHKFDANGKTPLSGVTFELKFLKASEQPGQKPLPHKFLLKEGEVVRLTTDAQGEVVFDNLDQGEYQITETSTTKGHSLLKDPIRISLPLTMTAKEASSQKNIDLSKAKLNSGYDDKYYFFECTYEVTNSYNFKVPTTGAEGGWRYGYIGMGMLAVLCAGRVIYGWKRRHKTSMIYRK
ncbi:MAG: SpaA isopeptide-forming pilin-related protein [Lachnospiraceae bacterium]|nr:SpaA isopeptide-forming pilin-related protein [Lachnospiraceae bacterium]